MTGTLAVIAKAPVAGVSKTRLCPPLTPHQAACLAQAALLDTLAAVAASRAARRVLVLDGPPGAWLPRDVEVIAQRGGGLDERLANAFEDLGDLPTLIIAMDTPQVTPAMLDRGLAHLRTRGAVLGPALDGGYWAIGLQRPDRHAIVGVPMSTPRTLRAQRLRLRDRGLDPLELEPLRDVDTFGDALAIAAAAPATRFAAALAATAEPRAAA